MRRDQAAPSKSLIRSAGGAAALRLLGLLVLVLAAAPTTAAAHASAALPDGRVYEQVSPVKKDANAAGSQGEGFVFYAWARDDGERVLYGVTAGPVGTTDAGIQSYTVSHRTPSGWDTYNPIPRSPGFTDFQSLYLFTPFPSADLSKLAFTAGTTFSPDNPPTGQPGHVGAVYTSTEGGPATWVSRPTDPTAVASPFDFNPRRLHVAGGSSDLGTLYFTTPDTLIAGEEARAAHIGDESDSHYPQGFFEYKDGVLSSAGRLPDGSLPEYGAAPSGNVGPEAEGSGSESFGNQVSADGSRAFFISPDPNANSAEPPQLYVHIDGRPSVLVSRSQLTGQEASGGVQRMANIYNVASPSHPYTYASSDGSHVYFQSTDRLTIDAPAGNTIKGYLFDVDTETLTYLPDVGGGKVTGQSPEPDTAVIGMNANGSQLLFANINAGTVTLKSWTATGGVSTVGTLSATAPSSQFGGRAFVNQVQATSDGSTYVFIASGEMAGFPNPTGRTQVYRYTASSGTVDCLSCPGSGVPGGNAFLGTESVMGRDAQHSVSLLSSPRPAHEMSSDGRRVFFDTSDALVPEDTNGVSDVYEWEDGQVHLISSGKNKEPSLYLDNSASGDDVFFTTAEGISPEDTDGGYDVYDARVGGGFGGEPSTPCVEACQAAAPTGAKGPRAGTATLAGLGNVSPPGKVTVAVMSKKVVGNAVVVRAKVPGAGTISMRGRSLVTGRRKVSGAGTYTLKARLTKAARTTLSRKGNLRLQAKLTYTPAKGRSASARFSVRASRG